jgi:hypothetical protein
MRARVLICNGLLVGALMLTPALAANAGAAAPAASSAVYIENRYEPTQLAIKPHGYYSHTVLEHLTWANWGQPTATASGSFVFQFCVEESCSVSPFYSEPVAVTLTGIQHCQARMAYTVLAFNVEAELPDTSFKSYRTNVAACVSKHSRAHAHRKHS